MDYVDLLYIHQPAGNWLAGYRQLEKAYKEGKAKAIGISNFEGKYIEELQTKWEIAPQFIQVEAHPYFTQSELRRTLDKYGIKLMSWYPLGHGDKSLQNEPVFAELGRKYGKTPAQVILRWHIQMGFAVIPGSRSVDHMKSNCVVRLKPTPSRSPRSSGKPRKRLPILLSRIRQQNLIGLSVLETYSIDNNHN